MAKLDYPTTLTNKEWQKAKGLIAKIVVGKTDVGASLTALETAFKKSDYAKDPTEFDKLDPAEFKVFVKSLTVSLDKQEKELSSKVADALKNASAAAGEMKGNSKVPASVTKYLSSMTAALGTFEKAIKAETPKIIDAVQSSFRKKLNGDTVVKALKDACAKLEIKWKALLGDIKAVEADPKIDTVEKVFAGDNNARGVATTAKFWDQLAVKQFPTTVAKIYTGKAISDYKELPFMSQIADQKGGATLKALVQKSGQTEEKIVTASMLKFSSSVVKAHELVNHMKALVKAVEDV